MSILSGAKHPAVEVAKLKQKHDDDPTACLDSAASAPKVLSTEKLKRESTKTPKSQKTTRTPGKENTNIRMDRATRKKLDTLSSKLYDHGYSRSASGHTEIVCNMINAITFDQLLEWMPSMDS